MRPKQTVLRDTRKESVDFFNGERRRVKNVNKQDFYSDIKLKRTLHFLMAQKTIKPKNRLHINLQVCKKVFLSAPFTIK